MDCRRNHSPLRQRRLESDAENRCCGRDRHHSDGFYLGLCRLRGTLSPAASATTFRRRAILLCSNDGAASILKSGLEIKNRCTQKVVFGENRASIRKSGLEIKNRCTQQGVNGENRASIPKSEPEIKNRCTQEGLNREKLASILKSGLEIKNRCTQEGLNREILASIPKFGLEIKNRCTQECLNREKLVSIPKSGLEIKNRCSPGVVAVCRRNHYSLQQRRMESDADLVAATAAAGETILCCDNEN